MRYSEEEYKLFRDELTGDSIGIIWSAMRADNFGKEKISFEEKKEYFFELINKLMLEGKIRLEKNGVALSGTIDEQIECYKKSFPKNEDDLFHDLWFTFEECPAGIVWIKENS